MLSRMAELTAIETRVAPVVQSFVVVMGVREGRPERPVVYVKLSGGDGECAIPFVGAGEPDMKVVSERIITERWSCRKRREDGRHPEAGGGASAAILLWSPSCHTAG